MQDQVIKESTGDHVHLNAVKSLQIPQCVPSTHETWYTVLVLQSLY
jgi:hypothetical protein